MRLSIVKEGKMKHFNVQVKQLDYIYNNVSNALMALLFLSFIIFYAYYDLVNTRYLTLWFSANIFLVFVRTLLYLQYKKTPITEENYPYFYKSFFLFTLLGAFLWGGGAFFIFPSAIQYQMIIIILIAGLISGAVVSLASKIEMFYAYVLVVMSPYAYRLLLEDSDASKILAFSILVYIFTFLLLAKKISNAIVGNMLLAEELQEKVIEANSANKAKSEFLSVMSHEIRTPLNAIMGFVQILLKKTHDAQTTKYLNTINQSSKVLTNVINDILDITKIESGKLVLESKEFHAKEAFENVYFLYEENAKEKNIKLLKSIDENIPEYLVSDIFRIKQMLSNLLSNAIKFTPEGKSIYLEISFEAQTNVLHCSVRDEGIGIAQEKIEKITQAFMQADSSTTRKYGGTGLGLSIVTKLLALFHTQLHIESKLGEGSRFSFNIPVQVMQKKRELQAQEEISSHFAGKKVLVAEDNKTNQMLIRILLEELELSVSIADDGAKAEKLYKEDSFDIILMDINMPNKNGTEAMLSIKEYDKKVPIVALTANAVAGDREKYISEGFDDYLAKPINNTELLKILQKYVS